MPRSIRQLIPEFDVRDAYIARPWIAVLIAPLGLAGYLLWVGNQMGDLGGYFTLQEGAWAHTFDYGEHTLDVLTGVAVGHVDYFFAYRYADTIGVLVVLLGLLLIPLLNRQRPPAVLTVYTLLTFALFLGSQQIFGNVSRYLFPAFPLFIPLAIPLSRLRLPMLCCAARHYSDRIGLVRGIRALSNSESLRSRPLPDVTFGSERVPPAREARPAPAAVAGGTCHSAAVMLEPQHRRRSRPSRHRTSSRANHTTTHGSWMRQG